MVGNGVDDAQLEGGIFEQQIAMLRVNIQQSKGNLPEDSNIDRTVVDEGAALAVCCDLAAQDAFCRFVIQFVLLEDWLHVIALDAENTLNGTFRSSGHDARCVSSLSHEQTQGAEDDGLTRACLASHDAEPGLQVDVECLDEDVIIDGQMLEHSS